jgi:hypothetical protein
VSRDLESSKGTITIASSTMMRIRLVGRKNGSGGRIEGTVLFELLSSQPDFVNEVTLLQYFAEQRLVPAGWLSIDANPCHPELAGEGIEYESWGAATQQKLAEKWTKDNFRKLVIQSLNAPSEN